MNNLIFMLAECNNTSILKILLFIKEMLNIAFAIIPIALILILIIDIFKTIISNESEEFKKKIPLVLKRLFAYAILFLVPTIINLSIDILNEVEVPYTTCWKNANKKTIQKLEKENAEELTIKAEQNPTPKNIQEAETAINQISDSKTKQEYEERLNSKEKEQQDKKISERDEKEAAAREKKNILDSEPNEPKETTLNGHKIKLEAGNDRVYFLDTILKESDGHITTSDAIVLESNNKYALIDTGIPAYKKLVLKYLKDIGATNLEFILITHAHSDHVGNYTYLIEHGIKSKALYVKDLSNGYSKDMFKSRINGIINISKNKNIEIKEVSTGNNRNISFGDFNIKLRNTQNRITSASVKNENMNSIVALATLHNKKIYFAADIGGGNGYDGTWLEKECAKEIGEIDIYKSSHHAIRTNNPIEALKILNPKYTINTSSINRQGTSETRTRILNNTQTTSDKIYDAGEGTVILTITNKGEIKIQQLEEDK